MIKQTKERLVLLFIIIFALVAVQVYIKRGVQGGFKLNVGEEADLIRFNQKAATNSE